MNTGKISSTLELNVAGQEESGKQIRLVDKQIEIYTKFQNIAKIMENQFHCETNIQIFDGITTKCAYI